MNTFTTFQTLAKVTPEELSPRIEAALVEARKAGGDPRTSVLATDADGTLWDGDVGIDMFDALLRSRSIRGRARDALAKEAREHGVHDEGDAQAIAERLYKLYEADKYPLDRAFAMMAWAFAGFHEEEMKSFAERVLADVKLFDRVRPAMKRVLAWARERGMPIWVVSASTITAVRTGAASLGVAADHVVAMTPKKDERGFLEPSIEGPIVYGDGKIRALAAALPGATIVAAFGDSAYDAAMLRASVVPSLVAPSAGLLEAAKTIDRAVLLDLG